MPALARKFASQLEPEASRKPERGPERKPPSKPRRKTFLAAILVTRLEEWFVEAESAEEARTLFAAGEGHRSASGACVHVELERLQEGAE